MMNDMLSAMMAVFSLNALITGINIFILFFAVGYFGSGLLKGFLEKRRLAIADGADSTSKALKEAEELKKQYELKLKNADDEAADIMKLARQKAKSREETGIEAARKEAEAVVGHARMQAELEKKRVNDEVKQDIIDMASGKAADILSEKTDREYNDELIKRALDEMGDGVWQS